MENSKVEEKKKIEQINSLLESNISGANENYGISAELNNFFFSDRSEIINSKAAKDQSKETPIGWLDAIIEQLKFINATNAGICVELRRLHKETT